MTFADGDAQGTYEGFTNTINGWYEEPFRYSLGFAGSPLFARLKSSAPLSGAADEIRLVHLGAEGKLFPAPEVLTGFLRLGAYQTTFNSRGEVGDPTGLSYLVGLGYEFRVYGVGIAPEASWRLGRVGEVRISGSAPCIGVHFYEQL